MGEENTTILILADSLQAARERFSQDANFVKTRFPGQARIKTSEMTIKVGTVTRYYNFVCTDNFDKFRGHIFNNIEYVEGCKFYPGVVLYMMTRAKNNITVGV